MAGTEQELVERLALYRRNIAGGWSGNHLLQMLQELGADESNLQKQQAATKAINSFLNGENNAERLIRGDSVLSSHFQEYANAGRINSLSFDLSGWDALEEYSTDVTKCKVCTWANVDPTKTRLPNGQLATMKAFLDYMKKVK